MIILYQSGPITIGKLTSCSEVKRLKALLKAVGDHEGWSLDDTIQYTLGQAVYLAAFVEGELVGGLRFIPISFTTSPPSAVVWPELCDEYLQGTAHVGLFMLSRPYRNYRNLFWLLAVELFRLCKERAIERLLLESTPATLAVYRRLGFPIRVLGEARPYNGELCIPCMMLISEVELAIAAKAERADTYRRLLAHARRKC